MTVDQVSGAVVGSAQIVGTQKEIAPFIRTELRGQGRSQYRLVSEADRNDVRPPLR
jgi:hypothetical protein